MKFSVLKRIWDMLDEGYSGKEIADFFYINPDIIDMIIDLKKAKVNLDVYA